jgi:outer membrane protein assembly factor BamB
MVYVGRSQGLSMEVVALDARTGAVRWRTTVAEDGVIAMRSPVVSVSLLFTVSGPLQESLIRAST